MPLTVLTITVAALLEHRPAEAQANISTPRDELHDRDALSESRFRFGIEQTVASFARVRFQEPNTLYHQVRWGNLPTDFTADLRVAGGFEVGLAVGLIGSHFATEQSFAGERIQATGTASALRLNPRVGYSVPLDPRLSLVPRMGVEYTRETLEHSSTQGLAGPNSINHYVSLTPGLMLQYRPVSWLFAAAGTDFRYQMYTISDNGRADWFSDQPAQAWWIDWMAAVGVRI